MFRRGNRFRQDRVVPERNRGKQSFSYEKRAKCSIVETFLGHDLSGLDIYLDVPLAARFFLSRKICFSGDIFSDREWYLGCRFLFSRYHRDTDIHSDIEGGECPPERGEYEAYRRGSLAYGYSEGE